MLQASRVSGNRGCTSGSEPEWRISLPPIKTVTANLDGSGQQYVVQGWDDAGTSVSLNGHLLWGLNGSKGQIYIGGPGPANPPGSGWRRNTVDEFLVGDVDGDHKDEIILINQADGWIGILKWIGTSLSYVNGSSPPVMGPGAANPPGTGWRIGQEDHFLVVDCDNDGKDEIFLYNNGDLWVGVLRADTAPLSYVWGAKGTLSGPGGSWERHDDDAFAAIYVHGVHQITVSESGGIGYLQFEDGVLQLLAMTPPKPQPTPPPTPFPTPTEEPPTPTPTEEPPIPTPTPEPTPPE